MTFKVARLDGIAAIMVIIAALALLIGARFDALWAGGSGAARSNVTTLIDENAIGTTCDPVDMARENILTCSGERKLVKFGDAMIWLDERTQLVVSNAHTGQESLTFYGGRIVVEGPMVFHVRDREIRVTGTATLVLYSWMNRLDVIAIDGDVAESSTVIASGFGRSFDTLVPYDESQEISTNYAQGSAADFYAWVKDSGVTSSHF